MIMKQDGTSWIFVLLAVLVTVSGCEVAQVREDSIGEQNPDEARPSEGLAENISSPGNGQALRLGRAVVGDSGEGGHDIRPLPDDRL